MVLGGRSAAEQLGVPVGERDAVDVYVRQSDELDLLSSISANPEYEAPNIHLHVVEDAAWPFVADQRHVEGWVAWLDLADGQDRSADALLDRLAGGRILA